MDLYFGITLLFEANNNQGVRLHKLSFQHPIDRIVPVELKFPGCENQEWCPLEQLVSQYQGLFLSREQWKQACNSQ